MEDLLRNEPIHLVPTEADKEIWRHGGNVPGLVLQCRFLSFSEKNGVEEVFYWRPERYRPSVGF